MPNARTPVSQAVFKEVFPIESYDEKVTSRFRRLRHRRAQDERRWNASAKARLSARPLHVTFRLKEDQGTKEEKVYMGEIPLMTPAGHLRHQRRRARHRLASCTVRRASALNRAIHPNGKVLFRFRIIPDRGSWLEVQFDSNDLLYIYLDRRHRRRKFLATTFLRALGYSYGRGNPQTFLQDRGSEAERTSTTRSIATKVLIADVRDAENALVSRAPLSR